MTEPRSGGRVAEVRPETCQLVLVRHAKASQDRSSVPDSARPLTDRGQRDATRMAERARRLFGRPDALVSSPALRALHTAQIFAEGLGIARDAIILKPDIYEASAQTLLRVIRGLDDRHRRVLLFGHNPGISEFAHLLAECPFDDMPTCALVQIELPVAHWRDAATGSGQVLQYSYPKQDQD